MRAARVESGSDSLIPLITGNEYFLERGRSITTPLRSMSEIRETMRTKATGVRWSGPPAGGREEDESLSPNHHPGDGLQLPAALVQRDKENVVAEIGCERFHHLPPGDGLRAGDLNATAGAETEDADVP